MDIIIEDGVGSRDLAHGGAKIGQRILEPGLELRQRQVDVERLAIGAARAGDFVNTPLDRSQTE
jgi:hypothetical protein